MNVIYEHKPAMTFIGFLLLRKGSRSSPNRFHNNHDLEFIVNEEKDTESIYSKTAKKAMLNVLTFCLGMLFTYYLSAALSHGVYSNNYIIRQIENL